MASLIFDKCCGCIELKTGCFIIGYFNLVLTLIFTILTALALVGGAVITADGEEKHKEMGLFLVITMSIILFFLILFLVFVIVLLVGLHKNKPGHVKAYLVYAVIFLVIYAIQFIAGIIGGPVSAGGIAQGLIALVINFYFVLVIRSMYYHMKDPSRGPAVYSAA